MICTLSINEKYPHFGNIINANILISIIFLLFRRMLIIFFNDICKTNMKYSLIAVWTAHFETLLMIQIASVIASITFNGKDY